MRWCPAQTPFTSGDPTQQLLSYLLSRNCPLLRELPSSDGSCLPRCITLFHPCLQEAAYSQWSTDAGYNPALLPQDERSLRHHLLSTATREITMRLDFSWNYTTFFLTFSSPVCFLHPLTILSLHLLKALSPSYSPSINKSQVPGVAKSAPACQTHSHLSPQLSVALNKNACLKSESCSSLWKSISLTLVENARKVISCIYIKCSIFFLYEISCSSSGEKIFDCFFFLTGVEKRKERHIFHIQFHSSVTSVSQK